MSHVKSDLQYALLYQTKLSGDGIESVFQFKVIIGSLFAYNDRKSRGSCLNVPPFRDRRRCIFSHCPSKLYSVITVHTHYVANILATCLLPIFSHLMICRKYDPNVGK